MAIWYDILGTTIRLDSIVFWSKSFPTRTQYLTLQKYLSHPSLVIYLFCTLTHKTEMGTANRWETTHSKPSLWLANHNDQGSAVRSYLLHSSLAGAQFCCLSNVTTYAGEQPFSWAKPAHFDFLQPILMCKVTHTEHWWGWFRV
jgi:hypothetical protein